MSTRGLPFVGHLLTVLAITAVAVAWSLLILGESGSLPGDRHGYLVKAVVPTSALLVPGARVTAAGADVGRVTKVAVSPAGDGARIEMRLTDTRVTPLPRDTRVEVRTRSQVGENYVGLVIGRSPQTLPSGSFASAEEGDGQVAVDQVLSVLQGRTKARARELIQGVGGGLAGRGDALSSTLRGTNETVAQGSQLTDVLYRDRAAAAELVDRLGRLTAAVGERGSAIDTIATRGLRALQAVGGQDAALREILRQLPGTLDDVQRTASTLRSVSGRAAPVLTGLAAATGELRPAVRDLVPATRDGRTVLRELKGAAPPLTQTLSAVRAQADPIAAALPQLRTTLCQANPVLRFVKPYIPDLFPVLVGLGSASNSYDATGHLVRLAPVVDENSLSGAPDSVNAAVSTLVQSGLLTPSKVVNYDPYAKPGLNGTTKATSNEPEGPESLKASGYVYPRVTADC